MAQLSTQQRIVEKFVDMVKNTSLSQVRVVDLVEQLGINRNTFYYYFSDAREVAVWIFRKDLAAELRVAFDESQLISVPIDDLKPGKEHCPFFVRPNAESQSSDLELFYEIFVRCLFKNVSFYRKCFDQYEIEFRNRIKVLYTQPMYDHVSAALLGRRDLSEESKNLFAEMGADYILFLATFYLKKPSRKKLSTIRINPFWGNLCESVSSSILAQSPRCLL